VSDTTCHAALQINSDPNLTEFGTMPIEMAIFSSEFYSWKLFSQEAVNAAPAPPGLFVKEIVVTSKNTFGANGINNTVFNEVFTELTLFPKSNDFRFAAVEEETAAFNLRDVLNSAEYEQFDLMLDDVSAHGGTLVPKLDLALVYTRKKDYFGEDS